MIKDKVLEIKKDRLSNIKKQLDLGYNGMEEFLVPEIVEIIELTEKLTRETLIKIIDGKIRNLEFIRATEPQFVDLVVEGKLEVLTDLKLIISS